MKDNQRIYHESLFLKGFLSESVCGTMPWVTIGRANRVDSPSSYIRHGMTSKADEFSRHGMALIFIAGSRATLLRVCRVSIMCWRYFTSLDVSRMSYGVGLTRVYTVEYTHVQASTFFCVMECSLFERLSGVCNE